MTRKDLINKINRQHRLRLVIVIALVAIVFIAIVWSLILSTSKTTVQINGNHIYLDSLYAHGKRLMRAGDYEESLKVMTQVGRYASEGTTPEDSDLATKAYNNAGIMNFFNTNYSGAYSFYKKAMETGGTKNAYYVDTNMAIIYLMFKDNENAEKLLRRAYFRARKDKDYIHVSNAYYNLLINSYMFDRTDSLLSLIDDYKKLAVPKDDNYKFISSMSSGVRKALDRKTPEAINDFKTADSLALFTRQPLRGRIDCNMFIAKTFKNNHQPDSSLLYYKRASELADTSDMRDYLVDIYERIADCYEELGHTSDELEYKRRYYSLKDSISSVEQLSAIRNLESNYETEKYENVISLMIAEKKMQSAVLITIICFLAVTIVLLTITFRQKRKLKTSNISLFNKNLELMKAFEVSKAHYLEERGQIPQNDLKNQWDNKNKTAITESFDSYEVEKDGKDREEVKNVEVEILSVDKQENDTCVPDEVKKRIERAIKDFFYSSDEYLKPDFSLKRLCEIVGSNRLYVSSVINNEMGTTFHALLNECRVNEAKIRLLDTENYGSMTIEAIAESLGYKSRSNFARNFKTCTGLTPSEFIAIAKASESADVTNSGSVKSSPLSRDALIEDE